MLLDIPKVDNVRTHSASKNDERKKLPKIDPLSDRAYSSRQSHRSQRDLQTYELPGFKKWNKPIQNGRVRSVMPLEERLACQAAWEVHYEIKKVLNQFFKPPGEDVLAEALKKKLMADMIKSESWKRNVLKEDDRTTQVCSAVSDMAVSTNSACKDTVQKVNQVITEAERVQKENSEKFAELLNNLSPHERMMSLDQGSKRDQYRSLSRERTMKHKDFDAVTKPPILFESSMKRQNHLAPQHKAFNSTVGRSLQARSVLPPSRVNKKFADQLEVSYLDNTKRTMQKLVALNKKELLAHEKLMKKLTERDFE